MKWVLVRNIPVNYHPAIMGDEDGRTVTFNSKQEAENFVEQHLEEDLEEIMIVPEKETTKVWKEI